MRSYGWNYALYFANNIEDMEKCLYTFGKITEIESDVFTIQQAFHEKYGVEWTNIPWMLKN